MKISQEEIDAAIVAYNGSILTVVGRNQINGMTAALTAAITVRKGRKAAKRERQRKEKDKQVVESVKPATNVAQSEKDDAEELLNYYKQNLAGLRGTGRPKGEQ